MNLNILDSRKKNRQLERLIKLISLIYRSLIRSECNSVLFYDFRLVVKLKEVIKILTLKINNIEEITA